MKNLFKKQIILLIFLSFFLSIQNLYCLNQNIAPKSKILSFELGSFQKKVFEKKYNNIFIQKIMPKSFNEFDTKDNLAKSLNRKFFKKNGDIINTYAQNILIIPEKESILKPLIEKIKDVKIKGLYMPNLNSYHVTLHTLYFSQKGKRATNFLKILSKDFKQVVNKYFNKNSEIIFKNMSLTLDGSLILLGIFKKDEDNFRIQQLRQELCNIQNSNIETLEFAPRKEIMDIIHITLGRLIPYSNGKEGFEIDKENFDKLKNIIDDYNRCDPKDKVKLPFNYITLRESEDPFHETPLYIESIELKAA